MKTFIFFVFIVFFYKNVFAQVPGSESSDSIAARFEKQLLFVKNDVEKISLINKISLRYLFVRNSRQLRNNYMQSLSIIENLKHSLVVEEKVSVLYAEAKVCEGGYYFIKQEYDSAHVYFQEAVKIAQERSHEVTGLAFMYSAASYIFQNNFKLAEHYLNMALIENTKSKNKFYESELMLWFSNYHARLNEFDKSEDYCMQAIKLKTELNDQRGLYDAGLFLISVNVQNSKYKDSDSLLNLHAPFYEKVQDDRKMSQIKMTRGSLNEYTGMYDRALSLIDSAYVLAKGVGDHSQMVDALNNKGIIYKDKGDFEEALKNYYAALEILKKHPDKLTEGSILSSVANVQRRQGKYKEAIQNNLTSIDILSTLGNRKDLAATYNNLGIVYKRIMEREKAYESYRKALDIFQSMKLKKETARVALNIIQIGGDPEKMEIPVAEYLNLADSLYRELGDSANIGEVLQYKGIVLSKKEKFSEATVYLSNAVQIFRSLKMKESLARSLTALGTSYLNIGHWSKQASFKDSLFTKAYECLNEAMLIAGEVKQPLTMLDVKEKLFIASILTGNANDGIIQYREILAFKDSIFNLDKSKELMEINTKYETEKKDKEIQLLSRENEIKTLSVKQQQAELAAYRLEGIRKQNEITLLNKDYEIHELRLIQTQTELNEKNLENKTKAAEIEIVNKDRELKQNEIEKQKIIKYSFLSAGVLIAVLALLFINRIQLRRKIEKQQVVMEERKRISSDMHDDLGSNLSKIALLSEVMKKNVSDQKEKVELEKISSTAQNALDKISEIVWTLNPRNDTLQDLVSYTREYIVEYLDSAKIECDISIPDVIPETIINGESRRNLFLSTKEALHNIVKHSGADRVNVTVLLDKNKSEFIIHDNGRGIQKDKNKHFGNGLLNMKQRMEKVNGSFSIENEDGTTVRLGIPLEYTTKV